jgi:hypothetical protein
VAHSPACMLLLTDGSSPAGITTLCTDSA